MLKISKKTKNGRWDIRLNKAYIGYIKCIDGFGYIVFCSNPNFSFRGFHSPVYNTLAEAKSFVRQNWDSPQHYANYISFALLKALFEN